MEHDLKVVTKNERETQKLGEALAKEARFFHSSRALVIALEGNLGAGKTVFAKGFARGLGIKEEMKSPTFILMRAFQIPSASRRSKKLFLHFDAYRISNAKEFKQIGFKNFLKDPQNILLVEWSDRVESLLPKDRVQIRIKHLGKDQREFMFYGEKK